jgi:Arc/MetJ-type ribon-helix-helix transcriptional regulator
MKSVEKVTVSLPEDLFARIEERRLETGGNRSEVVTDLLWRGWRQLQDEHREDHYRAAYRTRPETAPEMAWADMAASESLAATPGAEPRAAR